MNQIKHSSGPGAAHVNHLGRPLIAMAENDRGGGSAGGQGGQPAGGQPAGDSGEGSSALSEAAKREVGDMVNAAVNGAITNHLTRFKKQFSEDMTATLGNTLNPISEQLKALAEAQTRAPAPGKKDEGGVPESVRAEMLRYETRIKELEQANKMEREKAEAERTTRMRDEERQGLANVLRARGLGDAQVKAAVAVLHTEDKKVGRTDDGRIVFKFERGTGNARYTDELELDKGVDEWLKTEEGKGFVPARPAQGAGGQPARPGQAPRTPNEAKAQATADLAKMLLGGGT